MIEKAALPPSDEQCAAGEDWSSWDDVIHMNAQLGGAKGGFAAATRQAVVNKDLSAIEALVSSTDGAALTCYLHPGLDGQQPGGCPTLSHRDTGSPVGLSVHDYRMWVAVEAASGIISEHQVATCGVWDVPQMSADPFDETESPLWAFQNRALSRLGLRTKLAIKGSAASKPSGAGANYTAYPDKNCDIACGSERDIDSSRSAPWNLTLSQCEARCDAEPSCDCVTVYERAGLGQQCYMRAGCQPHKFCATSAHTATTYAKAPTTSGASAGALAYLKHDSMGPTGAAAIVVFNPGQARLQPSFFGKDHHDYFQIRRLYRDSTVSAKVSVPVLMFAVSPSAGTRTHTYNTD